MRRFLMKVASRKRANTQHKNIGVKRKRNKKDLNTMDQIEIMDQISQLPDHVIHHILSFLCTKDACRTRVLSKKWRIIWDSFPILDFDQRNFEEQEGEIYGLSEGQNKNSWRKNFKFIVDHSFLKRFAQNLTIQKFRLYVSSCDSKLAQYMSKWIRFATICDVKELDLQVKKRRDYSCPLEVLTAKTITSLRLHGCKLYADNDIKLPLLQKLNLGEIQVDQQIFENFISSCPLIEDLRLVYCSGLQHVEVLNLVKLNRVELHRCHDLKKVVIIVPNLQTFWYYGKKSVPCDINLLGCRATLKRLTLDDANMTDKWFEIHISGFPALEKLVLSRCHFLKSITISSERLKRLSLRGCNNLAEAMIGAPKLISFEYEGDKMSFCSMDLSSLQEAKLSFAPTKKSHLSNKNFSCNAELIEFLGKLNHSSGLKLVVRANKNVIVYEELREIVLPQISGLNVEIIKSSTSFEDLLDNVLKSCHPERFSLVASSCGNVSKFIHGMLNMTSDNPSCCRFYVNKCWRHYLEDFNIVSFNVTSKDAGDETSSEWIAWINSLRAGPDTFNFRLKWKRREGHMKA